MNEKEYAKRRYDRRRRKPKKSDKPRRPTVKRSDRGKAWAREETIW